MDEQVAIQLCVQHRDPRGFEFLVEKFRKEALFHAFGLLGNSEDAADACQEVFARAFAAMPQLRELDRFYPWFYRILRNHCLNLLKKRSVANRYLESVSDERQEEQSRPADPSLLTLASEEQREVWAALELLDPDDREILVMKYIRSQSYDAIASILDIPRGTVMSRLFHARKKFRTKYLSGRSGAAPQTTKIPS